MKKTNSITEVLDGDPNKLPGQMLKALMKLLLVQFQKLR